MAEICNVQPCTTSQAQFQAEQCAATDSQETQGHLYHWIPNSGALGMITSFQPQREIMCLLIFARNIHSDQPAYPPLADQNAPSEDSDQTARMRSLI